MELPLFRTLVLLLVLLPLGSAVLVPFAGRYARRVALLLAILNNGLTAAVVLGAVQWLAARNEAADRLAGVRQEVHRFQPEFVPGDPGGKERGTRSTSWTLLNLSAEKPTPERPGPAVQFFLGVDGFNVWLL